MSKFWIVTAESINYCGVSHEFCVEAPDNYDEEMIADNLELITRAEEAMSDYLDEEDMEDEDALLCQLTKIEEWNDAELGDHLVQTWAEHFVIEK